MHVDYVSNSLQLTIGASCIGEWLKHNSSLEVLYIPDNPVGDLGISQLMKGLHQNKKVRALNATQCGLTVEGTTCYSCNTCRSGLYI